jgi:ribonuclease P protein component
MFHFPKNQKLCNEKAIERLFENGKSFSEKPFRLIWNIEENGDSVVVKSLIIVAKKRIRLAVDRNLIRRRVKEAYRINKQELEIISSRKNQQLNLAIIYQKQEIVDYKFIEGKIKVLLNRLKDQL